MIEKSLELLNTDHVDLWQLHDVGLPEDVEAIFAKVGAMEALTEMHEQKVVRFLGVTGHYRPEALMGAINRHPFDTILMALNAADTHIHSFTDKLLPLAVEKQMGIIGMKVPARGRLLANWTPPPLEVQQHSWEGSAIATRPGVMNMRDAMHFVLSHPVSTIIIGCDNIAQSRRERTDCPRFHPVVKRADGNTERVGGARCKAVSFLPLYGSKQGLTRGASEGKDLLPVEPVCGGRMEYSVEGDPLYGVYQAFLKRGLTVGSAVLLTLSFSAIAGVNALAQDKTFVLERDGRTIVLEPYAANILRITMSRTRADATTLAGYGLNGTPAISGWRHEQDAGKGDVFRSGRLIVHVSPDHLSQSLSPQRMPLDDLNQSLREHYFGGGSRNGPNDDAISVTTASGKALLSMRNWSMVANRADGTPSQAGGAGAE